MKIAKLFSPYVWAVIVLAIFTYAQVLANLELPNYMAKIINDGIIAEDMDSIVNNGVMMLLITLGGTVAATIVGYIASRVAAGFSRDVRGAVFNKVESFSMAEFNKFSTASLITRSTNDIQQMQNTMNMLLRLALMAPFMAIGALQNAVNNAPGLVWIIAVAVLTLLVVITVLFSLGVPKFAILQQLVDKLNLVTRENLTGLRVVRAFHNEHIEEKKFDRVNRDLTSLNLFVNRLMVIMQPFMMFVMNLALVSTVWFGAHLINDDTVDIGNVMAFMQYAMQVIMSFLMISVIFIMIPRAAVSVKRIAEVLSTDISIKQAKQAKSLSGRLVGRVEFRDVTFSYPDADVPVLSGINFVAEPGQMTAFIGSTGSGKTTLINLIPRFYDVSAGQILIGGVDIKKMKFKDLRDLIGYVPQKGILFSGTIEENITFGDTKASTRVVRQAIEIAQANDFVKKYKDGLSHHISQGGANVSGGQKQRLSIARAIARNPEVFIFDDSFSALDYKTDSKLRQALADKLSDKTILVVGQRISTIMDADKIIVLDEGKIVGQGTHEELLENNSIYREIARSQLSDKELALEGRDV